MKKPYIVGNWKTGVVSQYSKRNELGTDAELLSNIVSTFEADSLADAANVVLCPPFTSLSLAYAELRATAFAVGAQNFAQQPANAGDKPVTGAVPLFALDGLVQYAILGHSEVKISLGESWQEVCAKMRMALETSEVTPIVCISEAAYTDDFSDIAEQINQLLRELLIDDFPEVGKGRKIVLAYEPFWAIGRAEPATASHIAHVVSVIRKFLSENGLSSVIDAPVIYGGSISADNTAELITECDLDGFLVGRASLDAGAFAKIVANTVAAYAGTDAP